MVKFICRLIGGAFCAFGLLGMLTPIPFGVVFFVIGLLFLIPSTPSAARVVRRTRQRIGVFDRTMTGITNRLPYPYRRILRETETGALD